MTIEKPLIVILGPTASGKTSWAIHLSKKFNGEIISADSRTIYEKMDIGTAKPSKKEQQVVPHYLLDIIKPDQEFSVADFQKLAQKTINQIHKKGKLPFMVGGTGLYIDAVCYNFKLPPISLDSKLRLKLAKKSLAALQKLLKIKDPDTFGKIDLKNKRRLIRALEVCITSGKKFSKLKTAAKPCYRILKIGVKVSREKLYEKINQRLDEMVKKGWVEEVQKLYKAGYDFNLPAISGLVYREIGEYVRRNISLEEALQTAKTRTRNFARRQMTWFRRDKNIIWIENVQNAEIAINKFLKRGAGGATIVQN